MAATRKSNASTRTRKAPTSTKQAGGGTAKAATRPKKATTVPETPAAAAAPLPKPVLRRGTHRTMTRSQSRSQAPPPPPPPKPVLTFGSLQEKQYNAPAPSQETSGAVTHTYVLRPDEVFKLRRSWLRTRLADRENFVWRWMTVNSR